MSFLSKHVVPIEIDASRHNYDLAHVEYKKAVDKAPNQPGTHMDMADASWNIGKWQSAEAEFKAELDLCENLNGTQSSVDTPNPPQ